MQFGLRWLLSVVTGFALVAGLARLSVSSAIVLSRLAWLLGSLAKALSQRKISAKHSVMLALLCVPTAILALVIAVAIIIGFG